MREYGSACRCPRRRRRHAEARNPRPAGTGRARRRRPPGVLRDHRDPPGQALRDRGRRHGRRRDAGEDRRGLPREPGHRAVDDQAGGRVSARIGVITFPGTLDDGDAARAVRYADAEAVPLWHADEDLRGVDAVVVPGGFSYGDYLRAGVIARFAPVMTSVIDAAHRGMPVLGICNGFQILCEAGLLPGAMIRNQGLHFICRDQWLRVENTDTAWTTRYEPGAEILIPMKNIDGCYMAEK